MLSRIRIAGFRSCQDVTLDDLGSVTALIGRNAAGKTNVLKAIAVMAQLACSSGPDSRGWEETPFSVDGTGHRETLVFDATVTLEGRTYLYAATASREYSTRESHPSVTLIFVESLKIIHEGSQEVVFTRQGETVHLAPSKAQLGIGQGVSAMTALASLLPADDAVLGLTDSLRRFFAQVRYYPLDEPAEPGPHSWYFIAVEHYREWLAEYNATGNLGSNAELQVLHLALTQKDRFAELKDLLGSRSLQLIQDIHIESIPQPARPQSSSSPSPSSATPSAPTGYIVFFRPTAETGQSKLMLGFRQLSQGTRRIVRLLTAMTYGDCSVMLIEHPEDGIHKGLVRKVAGLFTTGGPQQVLLSTHSDTLMNSLDPEQIRFVSLEDGWTEVRKLTPEERDGACEYIASSAGGTLSEFLHSVED